MMSRPPVNVAHKLFNTLPLVAIKKSLLIEGEVAWNVSVVSRIFVPVLCIRGPKNGMSMGCGTLVLHFGVPGATASFVCATLLDSRIACLVFQAIYVHPLQRAGDENVGNSSDGKAMCAADVALTSVSASHHTPPPSFRISDHSKVSNNPQLKLV